MILLWVVFLIVILYFISIDIEYDIYNNIGLFILRLYYIPIIYVKVNISKEFIVFTTSKKIYQ